MKASNNNQVTVSGGGNISGNTSTNNGQNNNNPYKDATDQDAALGSKRSTSAKPKVAVPTLNFSNVLK